MREGLQSCTAFLFPHMCEESVLRQCPTSSMQRRSRSPGRGSSLPQVKKGKSKSHGSSPVRSSISQPSLPAIGSPGAGSALKSPRAQLCHSLDDEDGPSGWTVQHGPNRPLVRDLLQLGSSEEAEVERMVKQYTAFLKAEVREERARGAVFEDEYFKRCAAIHKLTKQAADLKAQLELVTRPSPETPEQLAEKDSALDASIQELEGTLSSLRSQLDHGKISSAAALKAVRAENAELTSQLMVSKQLQTDKMREVHRAAADLRRTQNRIARRHPQLGVQDALEAEEAAYEAYQKEVQEAEARGEQWPPLQEQPQQEHHDTCERQHQQHQNRNVQKQGGHHHQQHQQQHHHHQQQHQQQHQHGSAPKQRHHHHHHQHQQQHHQGQPAQGKQVKGSGQGTASTAVHAHVPRSQKQQGPQDHVMVVLLVDPAEGGAQQQQPQQTQGSTIEASVHPQQRGKPPQLQPQLRQQQHEVPGNGQQAVGSSLSAPAAEASQAHMQLPVPSSDHSEAGQSSSGRPPDQEAEQQQHLQEAALSLPNTAPSSEVLGLAADMGAEHQQGSQQALEQQHQGQELGQPPELQPPLLEGTPPTQPFLPGTQPPQDSNPVPEQDPAESTADEQGGEGHSQQVGDVGDTTAQGESLLSTMNDFMKVTLAQWGQGGEAAGASEAEQEAGLHEQGGDQVELAP